MSNIKQNKVIMHCIVILSTLLAGLGIWSTVASYPHIPPFISTSAIEKSGPVTIAKPLPTQSSSAQPPQALAASPAPVQSATVPTPLPRLRTRAS